jgi:hypothetical protein
MDGKAARTVAPTSDNQGQPPSNRFRSNTDGHSDPFAASGNSVKGKGRLSSADNRPSCRGDSRLPLVNEISGQPLVLSVFPDGIDFTGDAIEELVQPGLYRKGKGAGSQRSKAKKTKSDTQQRSPLL